MCVEMCGNTTFKIADVTDLSFKARSQEIIGESVLCMFRRKSRSTGIKIDYVSFNLRLISPSLNLTQIHNNEVNQV